MAMTLEQMADDLQAIIDGERPRLNKTEMREYVRDLRAHLHQPAQVVDVGAIREVIADMRDTRLPPTPYLWCEQITRAIAAPTSNSPTTGAIGENGNG